jgi:hypothetical protein
LQTEDDAVRVGRQRTDEASQGGLRDTTDRIRRAMQHASECRRGYVSNAMTEDELEARAMGLEGPTARRSARLAAAATATARARGRASASMRRTEAEGEVAARDQIRLMRF